jgi:hypothetical protein
MLNAIIAKDNPFSHSLKARINFQSLLADQASVSHLKNAYPTCLNQLGLSGTIRIGSMMCCSAQGVAKARNSRHFSVPKLLPDLPTNFVNVYELLMSDYDVCL